MEENKGFDANDASVAGVIPTYQCFKKVQAFKIKSISAFQEKHIQSGVFYKIAGQSENGLDDYSVTADQSYITKHKPQVGGYFVVYEDGYCSFSPAEAFESGYALLEETL